MAITSMTFVFMFLPVALAAYYFFDSRVKDIVLLMLSFMFYAIGSIEYTLLFAIFTFINVLIGRGILDSVNLLFRKVLLIVGCILNTGLLIYYKYTNFIFTFLPDVKLTSGEISFERVALPLGISFFTFKAISYLVDVYRRDVNYVENPLYDALYLSFFAQIQSGPLSRYNDMILEDSTRFDFDLFADGAYRFLIGFSKKILLANVLSNVTTEIFNTPFDHFSTAYAWLGSICYSLQLFFDFAGYSDMAIGITEMFGRNCKENFNYPYMTESVSKFWRRWHISLSEWFRDYIYIPLGGSRSKHAWKVYFNLLVVWLLTGIWHGAAWNFIAWGGGYFVAIALERLLNIPGRYPWRGLKWLHRIISLLFINFQWVIFRSADLESGITYIKTMVSPLANELTDMRTMFLLRDYGAFIFVAILLSTPIVPWIGSRLQKYKALHTIYELLISLLIVGAFLWSISFVIAGQNNPFAYANF